MATTEKTPRLIFWLRIVAIAYALFLMLFSFDVFDIDAPFLEQVAGFIMHSVPSIALLIFGVYLTLKFGTYEMLITFVTLSLIPLLTGVGLVWAGRKPQ